MTDFAQSYRLDPTGEDKTNPQLWLWSGTNAMPQELAGGITAMTPSNLTWISFEDSDDRGGKGWFYTNKKILALNPKMTIEALIGEGVGLPVHSLRCDIIQAQTSSEVNGQTVWKNRLVRTGGLTSSFARWASALNGDSRDYRLDGIVSGEVGNTFIINHMVVTKLYFGRQTVERSFYGDIQVSGNTITFETNAQLNNLNVSHLGSNDYLFAWHINSPFRIPAIEYQYQLNNQSAWLPSNSLFVLGDQANTSHSVPSMPTGFRARCVSSITGAAPKGDWAEWFSS